MTKKSTSSKSSKDRAWDRAPKVRGKDPEKYRRCVDTGTVVYRSSHGRTTDSGWATDHGHVVSSRR